MINYNSSQAVKMTCTGSMYYTIYYMRNVVKPAMQNFNYDGYIKLDYNF